MIDTLFNYYLKNQEKLVRQYNGKYIVITKDGVVGAFDTLSDGYDTAVVKYGNGNFMIQLCTEGEEAYSKKYFTTRVTF